MLISELLLSEFNPEKAALYYRGNYITMPDGGLQIEAGNSVRFDTYFNAFFYGAYARYSCIETISLNISISGRSEITLFLADQKGNLKILSEVNTDGSKREIIFPYFSLSELPEDGMIFPEIKALSGAVTIFSGNYISEERTTNRIRVAAIICTYHREEYIKRNLNIIRSEIFVRPEIAAQSLDVFVVDNGKTLSFEETDRIRLFPNKNYGGSGGFTRGLIEALRCGEKYTHVLFMDDDISFEPETILRTIRFLRILKFSEKPVCIGGQMLLENKPTIQFEAGSSYINGYLKPRNQNFDLASPLNLLINSQPHNCQYNAWWYNCFPLSAVRKIGLPLPLFIKTDDIEYGLRMKADIVLLNGIGIWHMSFGEKYSPHLEYYIKRNELLVSALHHSGEGVLPSIWKITRASLKAALIGERKNTWFILNGAADFLKGPDFFLYTDAEQLNAALLEKKNQDPEPRWKSILFLPFRLFPISLKLAAGYNRTRFAYLHRFPKITCSDFWSRHLETEPIQKENLSE